MNVINKIRAFFQGKKTYLIALALVVYAVAGVVTGNLSWHEAVVVVLNGLGLGSVRAAIN